MATAKVLSRASAGLIAPEVQVEAHLSNGLPAFSIVGLPESTVREARERVRSALLNSYFEWPDHRITISLAPADIPKSGARFDLPIALALLAASGQLPSGCLEGIELYGELGLEGSLRPAAGLLPAVQAATQVERLCVVPPSQAPQLAALPGSQVATAPDLLTLCGRLKEPPIARSTPEGSVEAIAPAPDLDTVIGQEDAKRAITLAAAGGHHLLMSGPPGAGKTLLAQVLPGLLPDWDREAQMAHWLVRDALGMAMSVNRPFRAPHHTVSAAALIGGGARAQPGEVSLAHEGILFLDELPEFPRRTLDLLRQPLETGVAQISRSRCSHTYPARFQLVAAMNPCPCGFAGTENHRCQCAPADVRRYQAGLSGPILDRIDIHISLRRQSAATLLETGQPPITSDDVRTRVHNARRRQQERQGVINRDLSGKQLLEACQLNRSVRSWFEDACDTIGLSARGVHRALRVARTLADLDSEETVGEGELLEALSYRPRLVQ